MEKVSSIDSPEVSPHIASLIKSLTVVPPTAVPAIIDCVLASSDIPPSHLFSLLLHSLPDPSQAPQSNCILSHASAICYLIKNTEDYTDALRLLIWKVFVPILKVIEMKDLELVNEVEGLLLGAVSKMDSREILEETLVPYCLRSVGVSVGMIRNDAVAIYEWSTEDLLVCPGTLPLPIACRVLTSLLDPWLTSLTEIQREQKLEGFAANLMWDLSNLALGMLMRSINDRSFSIRMLLPTLFKSINFFSSVEVFVHGTPYVLSRLSFAKKIWKCCMSLFSLGHLERLDSYYVLSLYLSSSCNGELLENFARANICKESDLRYKKEFWDEIRRGLVDKDSSLRKQALHILKVSLHNHSPHIHYSDHYSSGNSKIIATNDHTISCNGTSLHANITKRSKWAEEEAKSLGVGEVCHLGNGYLNSHERWKVFLLLYEMLEEYGTHLVEAAWTHQVSLLFQSWTLKDYTSDVSCHVYLVQMETIEGIVSWLAVLWERGFFHENPQVRCLILQSFLSIDWAKYENCAQKVPRSFVLGPLVLGLNDVVHHSDFGIKGIYTSRTIQSATNFFGEYSRQLSTSARKYLVWGLASVAKQEAFGRAGLMALAFCIASSACQCDKYSLNEKHDNLGTPFELQYEEISQEILWLSRSSDLLEVLGIIIERSKQHFNPNYRLQVCAQVLKAASSLIDINSVSLDVLLHFLAAVPREFTDCAGSLRQTIQEWLTQCNVQRKGFGSSDTEELLLKDLYSFPVSFLKHKYPPNGSITFDDEDADAWRLEAERWARVLFLVIREAQHLEPVVMFLWNYFSTLRKQDCSMNQVALFKTILLILSLVEELQVERRKSAGYGETNVGRGYSRARKLDRSSLLVNFFECEKFVGLFSSIMEELSSFSRLVSPIFWEVSMKVVPQLPCSIKGKLGGPSQRRLASETTSCLLQAIMSVRALACISSLFVQLKRGDHCDSSFAYLWNFSWRIIHNQTYNTETAAELCLAGYEALAYVCKAWSTNFSASAFDFILSYNISHFPDGENIPLLDPMLLRFLQNINNLLAHGVLTRSRRAVLMNWKWHCLDSLLSISSNDLQNGNANRLFSDSTLRITFSDIVESLENAGEISVLYILRSARVVITLLYAVNTSETLFSGVTFQMMQKLVNSSWILHISCNKRRVASIAALLSAVLHQSLFSDLRMHETNDSLQGPFKWFIGKLLDEGTKSPRTIRLAALHLTGLWLLYPQTVKYYIKELKLLCLYGSVAFDEDFESELLENHDARSEVSLLAQSPDRELTEVFINTELYARVSVAVLFCKLGNLADSNAQEENEVFLAALECGKLFLLELLDSAVNDKDIAKELYKKYSAVHRRKVRAWQMICILSKFVDDDIILNVTSNLHICLYRNNLPAVRQYLETFAIQVYLKFPSLAEEQLIPIFCNYNMRPQALSSYVFIATNVILHASPVPVQLQHLNELLPPLVPFLTSHHHSLRGFTQLLVHYVLCKLWPFLVPDSSELALEKRCFENLKNYLAQNVDCARLRASMEGFLDNFDPNTSATPAGVFSPRNEGSEFECVPISLMEQVITFLNNVRDDLRNSIAKEVVTIENERMTIPDACKETVEVPNASTNGRSPQTSNDLSMDFQKKITIYEHSRQAEGSKSNWLLENSEFSKFLLEMEKEDQLLNPVLQSRNQAMTRIRESQQQFILVASLIDRVPNLAGLARTCEVFKAAALVVSDASIIQDKQFQLISVTAEKWVPIIEVPVNSLKVFLEKKRREGFSILGLEQTANSTPLDKFSFPNKTVLVLGREKEGIPVEIIHILDACIEIPQLGIIRSLNVHVSGAIALWEYTRQQRYKQS